MAKPFTASKNWTMKRGYAAGSSSKSSSKAPARKGSNTATAVRSPKK